MHLNFTLNFNICHHWLESRGRWVGQLNRVLQPFCKLSEGMHLDFCTPPVPQPHTKVFYHIWSMSFFVKIIGPCVDWRCAICSLHLSPSVFLWCGSCSGWRMERKNRVHQWWLEMALEPHTQQILVSGNYSVWKKWTMIIIINNHNGNN